MLALCRCGLLRAFPVVSCGVIALVVVNRLRKITSPAITPGDYERLRRAYGTRPSVN